MMQHLYFQRRVLCCIILPLIMAVSGTALAAKNVAKSSIPTEPSITPGLGYEADDIIGHYKLHDTVDLLNYELSTQKYGNSYSATTHEMINLHFAGDFGGHGGDACPNKAMGEETRQALNFRRNNVEGPSRSTINPYPKLHLSIPLSKEGNIANKDTN